MKKNGMKSVEISLFVCEKFKVKTKKNDGFSIFSIKIELHWFVQISVQIEVKNF